MEKATITNPFLTMASLPRWARVVLWTRFLRRITPLYSVQGDLSPAGKVIELVGIGERAAANPEHDFKDLNKGEEFKEGLALMHDTLSRQSKSEHAPTFLRVMKGISGVTAGLIAQPSYVPSFDNTFGYAYQSLNDHPYSSLYLGPIDRVLWAPVARDGERLLLLTREENWTDDSVVRSDWLGPLWPLGIPEYWKHRNPRLGDGPPSAIQIEFVVPAGLDEQARFRFRENVSHLYGALSYAHASTGGSGLRIIDGTSCEFQPSPTELPVPVVSGGGTANGGAR